MNIYRLISDIETVIATTPKITNTNEFMGVRSISCEVKSPITIPILTYGAYIWFRGEKFTLYDNPSDKKIATPETTGDAFTYTLTLLSQDQELRQCDFLDIVPDDSTDYYTGTPIVEFTGDVTYLAGRIQANLDRLYQSPNNWTVIVDPSAENTEAVSLSLTDSKVWDALTLVNSTEEWGLNFTIRGKTITIGSTGVQISTVFQYGRGKGLYDIQRNNVDSSQIITRLRAYGAKTNIPESYLKSGNGYVAPVSQYLKELQLPYIYYINGATVNAFGAGTWAADVIYNVGSLVRYSVNGKRYYCHTQSPPSIQPTNTAYFAPWPDDYIESTSAQSILGIREGIYRDESIYPTIKGMTVGELTENPADTTRVDEILACSPIISDTQSIFSVWIRDIGFNLNDYKTTETMMLSITNGLNLVGFDFEISTVVESVVSFPNGTSKYRLNLVRNSSEKFIIPDINNNVYSEISGDYLVPASGQELSNFVLTGISMPDMYVRAAEQRLGQKALEYLNEHLYNKVSYTLNIDNIEVARNRPIFAEDVREGDLLPIYDADLGIGESLESPKYIPIQNITITVGEELIPSYAITLSDKPVSTRIAGIENDVKVATKGIALGKKDTGDLQKEALSNLFLKAAFQGDTEIDGGVVATNLLLMRNILGLVTGGISGLADDNVLLFSQTYQNAIDSLSKILLRKDGSGRLASGNIIWDKDGNATFAGDVKANSGHIGLLKLISGSLTSDNVEFSSGQIQPLVELLTPIVLSLDRESTWTATTGYAGGTAHAFTSQATLALPSIVRFRTTIYLEDQLYGWEFTIIDGDGRIVAYEAGDGSISKIYNVSLPAGSYSIHLKAFGKHNSSATIYGQNGGYSDPINAESYIARTMLGSNGMYSFWANDKYIYYSDTEGFRAKHGDAELIIKDGNFTLTGLPTVAGATGILYNSSGTLKIS